MHRYKPTLIKSNSDRLKKSPSDLNARACLESLSKQRIAFRDNVVRTSISKYFLIIQCKYTIFLVLLTEQRDMFK